MTPLMKSGFHKQEYGEAENILSYAKEEFLQYFSHMQESATALLHTLSNNDVKYAI